MHSGLAIFLGVFAALVAGQPQITLTPTTIRGGGGPAQCPVTVTATLVRTVATTATTTLTTTLRQTVTAVSTVVSTSTVRSTERVTVTSVATVTATRPCDGSGAKCPTLTSTGTACRTCMIPGCVETVAVTQPCGCASLPTTTVNFNCNDRDVCNRIGCRTVYDVRTARC